MRIVEGTGGLGVYHKEEHCQAGIDVHEPLPVRAKQQPSCRCRDHADKVVPDKCQDVQGGQVRPETEQIEAQPDGAPLEESHDARFGGCGPEDLGVEPKTG